MKRSPQLLMISILLFSLCQFKPISSIQSQYADAWWNPDWPYRVVVTASEGESVETDINFSQIFELLGLNGALLDVRSIRVIAYQGGKPTESLSYEETYSSKFIDTQTLITDPSPGVPYWFGEEDTTLSLDRATLDDQPTVHASLEIDAASSIKIGTRYDFNHETGYNWTGYETMIYDVFPRVNASAVDQTPDLYQFELGGVFACSNTEVGGPGLIMKQWNAVSLSLVPYGDCPSPDLTSLDYLRFFVNVYHQGTGSENHGYYEPGDQVDLWLDNFRLVDQDNGSIRWNTTENADSYYIYFDTLNHEGHPLPELTEIADIEMNDGYIGAPEAGGYFHQISDTTSDNLSIWTAPITEKITPYQVNPVIIAPLQVKAARGELEAFQLVIRSPNTQDVTIMISDLVHSDGTPVISGNNVEVFRVDNIDISKISDFYGRVGLWPDPLYPITSESEIELQGNANQPIWFRIRVPKDAKPGVYEGNITIETALIPLRLEIWDFTLPESAFINSKFGFDWDTVMEVYGGTIAGVPQACHEEFTQAIIETFEDYHLTPLAQDDFAPPDGVGLDSLTAYEVTKAQNEWLIDGTPIWWQFNEQSADVEIVDDPPLPNPTIIDRPGIQARILPWLAWVDRIEGFYDHQIVDWEENPWDTPYTNSLSNGNGYLFYPPKDEDNTIAFDPCNPQSNRLIPSIRLELLREGMEDYAYMALLNGGKPRVGEENPVDILLDDLLPSRTVFTHAPLTLDSLRDELAAQIIMNREEIYLPILLH